MDELEGLENVMLMAKDEKDWRVLPLFASFLQKSGFRQRGPGSVS